MIVLHWLDYLIFVALMAVSLGIGVFHSRTGGKQRTLQEFIMADRKLKVIPTMLSIIASYHSAIMILGSAAEEYNWGTQAWVLGLITNAVATVFAERFIVPWLYPLKLSSTYEYLEMRFQSRAVSILGAVIGMIKATLYMGIAIYTPSIALESAVGLPASVSIPLMAAVCTLYTALGLCIQGGMRAVIWTDVLQVFVMLVGMLALFIKGVFAVGGFEAAFAECEKGGRLNWVNLSMDPTTRHTLWNFVFGMMPIWAMIYGIQQASVQRFSATQSLGEARLCLLLVVPTSAVFMSIAHLTGILGYAYYSQKQCDPRLNGDISSTNQIVTHFVNELFRNEIGFSGLFLATLYSGALSTISSSQSGCAANMWDCVLKYRLGHISEPKAAMLNKFLVVMFGCAATGVAFLAATMPGPVSQISGTFGGAAGGPLMGVFALGGMVPFVEKWGVISGALAGLCLNLWIGIGSRTVPPVNHPLPPVSISGCDINASLNMSSPVNNLLASISNATSLPIYTPHGLERLYSISYMWYPMTGCLTCIVAGIMVSAVVRLMMGVQPAPVPRKLLIPWRAGLTWNYHHPPEDEELKNGLVKNSQVHENLALEDKAITTAL